jgi:hypothetical protein
LKPHIFLLHNLPLPLPGWARLPILIMENVEVSLLLVSKTMDDAPELSWVRLSAIVCPFDTIKKCREYLGCLNPTPM